jgi:hypothetical protein
MSVLCISIANGCVRRRKRIVVLCVVVTCVVLCVCVVETISCIGMENMHAGMKSLGVLCGQFARVIVVVVVRVVVVVAQHVVQARSQVVQASGIRSC